MPDTKGDTYAKALQALDAADDRAYALFPRFKAEWVKISDDPISLDGLDLSVSLRPDFRAPCELDWDDLELTGDYREYAFDLARHIYLGTINRYEWPATATGDDKEAQEFRVRTRIETAYARLYGVGIMFHDEFDGRSSAFFLDMDHYGDTVYVDTPDRDDVELRGAYDEVAQKIKALDDIGTAGRAAAKAERERHNPAPEPEPAQPEPVYTVSWDAGFNAVEGIPAESRAAAFTLRDDLLAGAEFPDSTRIRVHEDGKVIWSQMGSFVEAVAR